jgi:anti-anti-sigma factor
MSSLSVFPDLHLGQWRPTGILHDLRGTLGAGRVDAAAHPPGAISLFGAGSGALGSGPLMTALEVRNGHRPGLYQVVGELDLSNAHQLETQLRDGLSHADRLELDLSGLSFMDSSGLKVILRLARDAEAQGRSPIVLSGLSPVVSRLFQLVLPNGCPQIRIDGGLHGQDSIEHPDRLEDTNRG